MEILSWIIINPKLKGKAVIAFTNSSTTVSDFTLFRRKTVTKKRQTE